MERIEKNIFGRQKTIIGKEVETNMLLDDGGDLTAIMHNEYRFIKELKVSEETTTGIKALKKWKKKMHY